jgi:hypothetical protein
MRVLPLALVALVACRDAVVPITPDPPVSSKSVPRAALEYKTPTYPAVAVYIVYREYVNLHPRVRHLSVDDKDFQKHMEKRLRELYPRKGYTGMMRDAVAEHRRNVAILRTSMTASSDECPPEALVCENGEPNQPTYSYDPDPSWEGEQEFPVDESIVPTVQEEIDSLQATPAEADGLRYYETLALTEGDYRLASTTGELTRDDRIRAAASGRSPDGVSVQAVPLAVSIPLGVAAFFGARIAFSWWRAVDASGNHYPNLEPGDTRRDAFRHTYLSVMLRRYCTSPVAKMVTDLNEDLNDGNPAASKYMDFLNNDLGREVKYSHFRGRWFWDRWSWGVWSHRVRDYINDGNNGVFIGGWAQSAPTEENARAGEALVPDHKYIYFR